MKFNFRSLFELILTFLKALIAVKRRRKNEISNSVYEKEVIIMTEKQRKYWSEKSNAPKSKKQKVGNEYDSKSAKIPRTTRNKKIKSS